MEDLFTTDDYIYIDNFYLQSGTTITDYSGVYQVSAHTAGDDYGTTSDITLDFVSTDLILKTNDYIIDIYDKLKFSNLGFMKFKYRKLQERMPSGQSLPGIANCRFAFRFRQTNQQH